MTMATDITDAQVDQLLRDAEERLRGGGVSNKPPVKAPSLDVAHTDKADSLKSRFDGSAQVKPAQGRVATTTDEKLSVRVPETKAAMEASKLKDNAGSHWFNLPKTNLTPEFKRDWQLLRMSGILDPKHQKKSMRATPPEYSQVGEIIAGPTEFYSARLTRKERKRTVLEETMASVDTGKLKARFAGIQKNHASGKKGHYRAMQSKNRKKK